MELLVQTDGTIRCVYGESIELACLGRCSMRRASHVEPTTNGQWLADLSPILGPQLGPFAYRSQAIAAEVAWLQEHWLAARTDA